MASAMSRDGYADDTWLIELERRSKKHSSGVGVSRAPRAQAQNQALREKLSGLGQLPQLGWKGSAKGQILHLRTKMGQRH